MFGKKLLLSLLILGSLSAQAVTLKPDHPKRYTVQKADTVWAVADSFLSKPWDWPKLWHQSGSQDSPPVLLPGAVVALHQPAGKPPYLTLVRRAEVTVLPGAGPQAQPKPIPPVARQLIRPYLSQGLVLDATTKTVAPYVIGFADDRIIGGDNTPVFVSELPNKRFRHYTVFRPVKLLRDPKTTHRLGYYASYVADVALVKAGKPATVKPTHITAPIRIGDQLAVDSVDSGDLSFYPRSPIRPIDAQIIHIANGIATAGVHQMVVLSRGRQHGVRPGDVLVVVRPGKKVVDPVLKKRWVKLPDERIAELMIFRTFNQVSFALCMKASAAIQLSDHAINPA